MLRSKNNNLIWNGSGPRLETGHPVIGYSFIGPDSVHLSYNFDAGGKDWRIVVNSGEVLVTGSAGGLMVGTYHHTGLSPESYTYIVQTKDDNEVWNNYSATGNIEIDGLSAKGTLLYDESYTGGLRTDNVTVPSGRSLELGGLIQGIETAAGSVTIESGAQITLEQGTEFSSNVSISFGAPVSIKDVILGGVSFSASAIGSSMENVIFSGCVIDSGATVELKGFIESRPDPESSTGERLEADLGVYGTVTFATDVEIGSKVQIGLYSAHQISGLTSGHLVLEAEGSVISDSSDLKIDPRKGGTLSQLTNCVIFLEYAESSYDTTGLLEGYKLVISDSTIFSIGRQASRGRYELNKVVWKNPVYFAGDSETQVLDSDFQGQVRVGYDYIASPDAPQPETVFNARNTRFHSMDVQRVLTGNVRFDTSLFKGDVGVYGGASEFDGCEFGGIVTLVNRSTTKIQNSLFLKDLKFLNAASTAQAYPDAPRWFEQPSPSPSIEQNAFMGEVAISYEKLQSQQNDPLPSAKIAIGPNYYGDKSGFLVNVAPGFLASTGKHFGARIPGVGLTSATDIFDLAKALADSPISGTRLDTRVFPKFWVNGHVVGQNTLQHQNSTLDDAAQLKLIPGRPTLLSVNVMTTEPSLSGVRVYANWNGQKIYARNRVPMRRDISTFTTNQITYPYNAI